MAKIDDGGKAFPHSASVFGDKGMSLRDYIAVQALNGQLAGLLSRDAGSFAWKALASECYSIADAMIAARKVYDAD